LIFSYFPKFNCLTLFITASVFGEAFNGTLTHVENDPGVLEDSLPSGSAFDLEGCLYINSLGRLGVGTNSPNYRLDVAGKIRACEVKVDLNSGECPDYVFADSYKLMSIETLEKFINENEHLPEMKPAQEVESEGMNLKEMNIKLLKKIEEMTLYIIEINKRMNSLESENIELKEDIEKLKSI
jgi:hypothetical protein